MKELFESLKKVQESVGLISKDSKGYNYTYASLPHVIDTVYPALYDHGFVLTQLVQGKELETILWHTSGEKLTSRAVLEYVPNDPQKQGSAISYMRRYALVAMLGLAADDDDGSSAKKPYVPPQKPQAPSTKTLPNSAPINGQMYQNMIVAVKEIEAGWRKVEAYTKTHFNKNPKVLTISEYEQVMKIIKSGAL